MKTLTGQWTPIMHNRWNGYIMETKPLLKFIIGCADQAKVRTDQKVLALLASSDLFVPAYKGEL